MRLILLCAVVMLAGCTQERYRCIDGKVMVQREGISIEAWGYRGLACKEDER